MADKPKKLSDTARALLTMAATRGDHLIRPPKCRLQQRDKWFAPCSMRDWWRRCRRGSTTTRIKVDGCSWRNSWSVSNPSAA